MLAWAVVFAIDCSQPRIDFRHFYAGVAMEQTLGKFYRNYETPSQATSRLMNVVADYQDYLARYQEKCR